MKYYAVKIGRNIGIYDNWLECKKSIHKFKGAQYKSFNSLKEAQKYLEKIVEGKKEVTEALYVYTDGACKNNGKENATAAIGVYFSENDSRNVSRRIKGKQTNNVAEVKAIIEVYKILKKEINSGQKIFIVSDSIYAIRAATTYGNKVEINNYQGIANSQLVKKIHSLYKDKENVNFLYIKAHTNREDGHYGGNKQADLLAVKALI